MYKVYILGAWHQGFVIAGVLAENKFDVTCIVNSSEEKVLLESLQFPVSEPGLIELVKVGKEAGNLHFRMRDEVIFETNSVVVLAHDTKVNEKDESDLSDFNSDLRLALLSTTESTQILISAQIPVGTCEGVILEYSKAIPNLLSRISVLPENLRLGKAIERFRNPPLPVVGCSEENQKYWNKFFDFTGVEFSFCTQTEAELLKHSLNSYLAMNIAFGNEIHRLGSAVGANGKRIMELLEIEPRVGKFSPKRPGLPFFGGTLARDLVSLNNISEEISLETPLVKSILDSNDTQKDYVLKKILDFEELQGTKIVTICVIGLTYTAETSTLRRSPGLWLIEALMARGFNVTAYDPRVKHQEMSYGLFTEVEELSANNVDCFILLSPWSTLKNEISEFVTEELFVDVEGYLSHCGVALPLNYRQVF
jgi:UDPglucose 6-dehydrogenase